MNSKDEIKKLGENLSSVMSELAETVRLKKELDARDVSQPLLDLEAALEAAKTGKEHTLKLFASGAGTRKDLEMSQSKVDAISNAIIGEKEIIDATEELKRELSQKIQDLNQKERGAYHKFWFAVTKFLQDGIANTVKDEVSLAWMAALKAGGRATYRDFLVSTFPQPSIDSITELQPRLEKEYGVK